MAKRRKKTADRGFGALPPLGSEWILGKTAASILFVGEAENYLSCSGVGDEEDARIIVKAIKDVKDGKLVLNEDISVGAYLDAYKKQHGITKEVCSHCDGTGFIKPSAK